MPDKGCTMFRNSQRELTSRSKNHASVESIDNIMSN